MGRLFTYMVKAAAGNQYGDYTLDQYAAWLADGAGFDSPYYNPAMEQRIFDDEKKFAREVAREPMAGLGGRSRRASLRRFQRLVANVRNQQRSRGATYINNTLSQGGTLQPWAVDHLQKGYGITNDLLKNERFQKYISEVNADNQSDVRNAFRAMGITWDPKTSDYRDPAFIRSLQAGIRAGKWNTAAPAIEEAPQSKKPQSDSTAAKSSEHADQSQQTLQPGYNPIDPLGTSGNTGAERIIPPFDTLTTMPKSNIGNSPLDPTQPDQTLTRLNLGPTPSYTSEPVQWEAPQPIVSAKELAWPAYGQLRDTIQQNIAAGRSMYDGMTTSTPGMSAGQRQALTAPGFAGNQQQPSRSEHEDYTGAGLRMVGHSADGKTRTYVGKSGRGRITVGDNAHAGHYRGVGAVDTNTRSNYADLRQPNATRPVTAPNVRKLPAPARR